MGLTNEQRKRFEEISSKHRQTQEPEIDLLTEFRQQSVRKRVEQDAPRQPEEGFFSRLKEGLSERAGELKKTFTEMKEGKITPAETAIRYAGDVAGGVGDVIGAAVSPAIQKLTQVDALQPAFQALGEGMENYEEWKNSSEGNRRIAEVLEAGFNIADVVGLKFGGALAKKAGKEVAETAVGQSVKKAAKEGLEEVAETTSQKLAQQVTDEAVDITQKVLTGKEKGSLTKTKGGTKKKFGAERRQVTEDEIRVAKSVEDVVGGKNMSKNRDAIVDKIERTAIDMEDRLTDFIEKRNLEAFKAGRMDDVAIHEKKVLDAIKREKNNSKILFGKDGAISGAYDTVADEFLKIYRKELPNELGLLNARKKLDKVLQEKFPDIFDKKAGDNVRRNAMHDVRKAVNDLIEKQLPEGTQFKAELKHMADMYTARDGVASQIKEVLEQTAIKKALRTLNDHSGSIFITGSLLGGVMGSPLLFATALTYGSVKTAKGIVTSQALKKAIIKTLEKINIKAKSAPRAERLKLLNDAEAIRNMYKEVSESIVGGVRRETLEDVKLLGPGPMITPAPKDLGSGFGTPKVPVGAPARDLHGLPRGKQQLPDEGVLEGQQVLRDFGQPVRQRDTEIPTLEGKLEEILPPRKAEQLILKLKELE